MLLRNYNCIFKITPSSLKTVHLKPVKNIILFFNNTAIFFRCASFQISFTAMARNQENTYYNQCMCTSVEYAFDSKVVKDKHPYIVYNIRGDFLSLLQGMMIRVQM